MPTPHNAAVMGDIAETVLLPGDPLRAKFIADNFLQEVVQFNGVRNMFGFTGTYNGKKVSVMGTGMGCPSIGIYAYELIHFYGVKNVIRIGSIGATNAKVNVGDIIIAGGACTNSNWAFQYGLPGTISAIPSFDLLFRAKEACEKVGATYHVGNILSSDVFYDKNAWWKKWAEMGILGVEMESYALYTIAMEAGVNALTICTVSDSLVTGVELDAEARQNTFTDMMKVALEVACN